MKVLVACEFSGVVRDAFRNKGHHAISCDLLDTEIEGPHMQGDVRVPLLLQGPWDLMIAHPPCTHLAASGARWFKGKEKEQAEALAFVQMLLDADIPKIALENPVSIISTRIRKPDQIIQPWMFGEDTSKRTCLWLKNLPKLQATDPLIKDRYSNQTPSGQNNLSPSETRWKDRSRTYSKIADAMAQQWG